MRWYFNFRKFIAFKTHIKALFVIRKVKLKGKVAQLLEKDNIKQFIKILKLAANFIQSVWIVA